MHAASEMIIVRAVAETQEKNCKNQKQEIVSSPIIITALFVCLFVCSNKV